MSSWPMCICMFITSEGIIINEVTVRVVYLRAVIFGVWEADKVHGLYFHGMVYHFNAYFSVLVIYLKNSKLVDSYCKIAGYAFKNEAHHFYYHLQENVPERKLSRFLWFFTQP